MFFHEFEEPVKVESGIGFACEIKLAGGMFLVGQTDRVGAPLDVGGDTTQARVLEPLEDRLPVARLEPEVLNLGAKDFTRINRMFHARHSSNYHVGYKVTPPEAESRESPSQGWAAVSRPRR